MRAGEGEGPPTAGPRHRSGASCGRGLLATLLVLAALVGLAAHDVEVAVELDVGLATVVEGDLDLVVALLVADLGVGDAPWPVWASAAALACSSAGPLIGFSLSSPTAPVALAIAAPPPPRAATQAATAMIFLLRVMYSSPFVLTEWTADFDLLRRHCAGAG